MMKYELSDRDLLMHKLMKSRSIEFEKMINAKGRVDYYDKLLKHHLKNNKIIKEK